MARLAGRRRLRLANAAALGLLGSAAGDGAAQASPRPPASSTSARNRWRTRRPGTGVLAFDRINPDGSLTGVVRYNGAFTDLPGMTPDVDGTRVVVDTGPAFEILDYRPCRAADAAAEGPRPRPVHHWLVYRRVTTRRRLILYDLSTDQSRVIATVKMRSDLGEPDISGRRVVFSVTGRGRSSIRVYRWDVQTTRRVLQTPIWSYSHAVDQRDHRDVCAPGARAARPCGTSTSQAGVRIGSTGSPAARATRCGRRPRERRPPTSRSTPSRSRSSGMLEAWQPRLRRRVSCAPHSSRRRSGARAISTAWATCPVLAQVEPGDIAAALPRAPARGGRAAGRHPGRRRPRPDPRASRTGTTRASWPTSGSAARRRASSARRSRPRST